MGQGAYRFMGDRQASLVINGHKSAMTPMSTGIPQGSLVSPILFNLRRTETTQRTVRMQKRHSVVDTAACLTEQVYQSWNKGYIAGALVMDVKGAFDRVSRTRLTARMQQLKADPQLIRWTDSFMKDRRASLVINGHESAMKPISTGIPQDSPVSPILFAIFISGVFDEVEAKTEGVSIAFVDDTSWMATGKNVTDIGTTLEQCAKVFKVWVRRNAVEFDIAKTEAILFAQKNHRRRLRMKINLVNGTKIAFNKGATRWLGF